MNARQASLDAKVTSATITRLPSLDGWRAISIVMVLGGHCVFTPGFPPRLVPLFETVFPAELGVHFFFVISGFLISWLLMVEDDTYGRVSLKHFYARRALRILPVCLAFLAILGVLQALGIYTQGADVWLHNLTFTTNFLPARPFASAHLWSLGVEEQFYLFWPPVFVLCGVARSLRVTVTVLSLPLLVAPAYRLLSHEVYLGFLPHMDGLAIGCLAAVLLMRQADLLKKYVGQHLRPAALLGIILIVAPTALRHAPVVRSYLFYFGRTLQDSGFAILLLQSVLLSHRGAYRLLNIAWVRQIGVLSFSLYIWQEVFCSPSGSFTYDNHVWWLTTPFWLIVTFLVAAISYYGLERPLFRLRAKLRHAR